MSRIDTLLQYLHTSPQDSFLQHALALEYVKMGDDVQARNLFEKLLEREPSYVGSYYHLAKLLERVNEPAQAKLIYEAGMKEAGKAGDRHAYNELQAALEDLDDE